MYLNREQYEESLARTGSKLNIIKIEDSRFLIKYACEDLRSLRSVLQSLQNRADCPDSQDVLAVVIRALEPIIGDIHKAVDMLGEELKGKERDSDKQ